MKALLHFTKRLYSFSGNVLFLLQAGTILISLLDGAAIFLLIPMLSIGGILQIEEPSSILSVFEFMEIFPKKAILPMTLGTYIVFVVGQSLLERALTIRTVKIQQGFLNHVKEETYQSLLEVKWAFYLKARKTNLINSLTKDINRVGTGIKMLMQFTASLIFTVIQIGLAFWLSAQISSLILICGLALALFSWKFIRQAKAVGNKSTQSARKYFTGITDHLHGIKDIKTNALESARMNWLKTLNRQMLSEQVLFTKLQTNSQLSYKSALAIIISFFIYLSVNWFHSEPGKLLVLIMLFSRLWPRFVGIQSSLQQLALTLPSFKILYDLQTSTKVENEACLAEEKELEPLAMCKMLECRNVFFRYNQADSRYALRSVSVQIPINRLTAIVGKSGAGKSTLVDLLSGLHRPEKGELLLDGTVLTDKTVLAFRKTIGFVPQDPFLFNASLKENLMLMNSAATEDELWDALEMAAAADFVRRLPQGLQTRVGDRGISLSGGERQRLVLARALLKHPSVLILDEATSALDAENEARIREALEKLKGKMTIILIAHRPSTIQNADQVIELEGGKVKKITVLQKEELLMG